jgi:hypothetical protein
MHGCDAIGRDCRKRNGRFGVNGSKKSTFVERHHAMHLTTQFRSLAQRSIWKIREAYRRGSNERLPARSVTMRMTDGAMPPDLPHLPRIHFFYLRIAESRYIASC